MGLLSKFRIHRIRTRIFLLVTTLVALIFIIFVFYFPKRLESQVLKALSARYTSLLDMTARLRLQLSPHRLSWEGEWRRRDLNPRHCGYEPHALTD